ncbi:Uncharacterised protein [Clostridium tertium]|uniref:DUF2207 domain-containing protein n=1 Tax=Clostridium tertium TaxID=1559 RepID=A0A6N2YF84_9CLOT
MKKFLTILFTLLLIFPKAVFADSKSYSINDLFIDAEIQENGDVLVDETFTYDFNGSFNGIYIDLNMNKIDDYEVMEVTTEDNNAVIEIPKSDSNNNNTYETILDDDKLQIKIYSKSSNETKKFRVKYKVIGAAKKYTDSSLLYWSFYTASSDSPVNNINLNISLKDYPFDLNILKYTVFGDGTFKTNTSEELISISGNDLTSDIGIQLNFQKDFLNTEEIDRNSTEAIEEDDFKIQYLLIPISILILAGIVIFIFVKINNKKFKIELEKYRAMATFPEDKYLPYIPSNLSPALVAYMVNKKDLQWSLVPSTLLYLVKLGVYEVDTKVTNEKEFNSITFKRIGDIEDKDFSHLETLVNWFKKYENHSNEFTFNEIKKKLENNLKESQKFKNSYYDFINEVRLNGRALNYYITIKGREVLNNDIYRQYCEWQAYKNYLLYDTNKENVDIRDLLIYSFALGIKDSQIKELISEDSLNRSYDPFFNYYFVYNMIFFNDIKNSAESLIDKNNASNNDSFSSFSSGGGFSGGGGGGSGAF